MNGPQANDGRNVSVSNLINISIYLVVITCFLSVPTFAQNEAQAVLSQNGAQIVNEPPLDVAPPPLKLISPDERKTLDNETGIKKRTQISLEMMESRLMKAEQLTAQDNYKLSLDNLAGFQAILENTFTYLEKNDNNNKADSRFKQLEIFLRKQVPRLENLRRTMPYKFGYYVLKLMKVVRDTRAKAVEPLFADTVLKTKES